MAETIILDSQRYALSEGTHVRRSVINDWSSPVPSSGAQDVGARYRRSIFQIKDIKDAFSHQVELRWDQHKNRDGVVVIDHLSDSNMETRHGPMYAPSNTNNPSNPTDVGISGWVGVSNGTDRPSAVALANRNPKAAVFFTGTTNAGVFTWRVDDTAANNYDLDALRWSGTAWGEEANILAASSNERLQGCDMVIHKGALCFLYEPVTGTGVSRSTNGDTFADMTNGVGGTRPGSRLLDAGNTLYAFSQDRTTTGNFDVLSTADNGATAWSVRSTNHPGKLCDVEWFYDWVTESDEIFIMTEGDIFTYDTTNFVLRHRKHLSYRGRAMAPFHINSQRALLLFLDAERVYALLSTGVTLDISPGGSQGMPSGKDFGPATEGMVCIARTGSYVYALWSGLDTAASNQKPLLLAFTGYVQITDGQVTGAGWHFIWQDTGAKQPWAARFLAFDPVSGDLLFGLQGAVSEDTTLYRLQDIEVNPELQATQDRLATAVTFTTPRLDMGGASLSSTIWDAFFHTSGLGTGKSFAIARRVNGSTGSFTTVGSATTTDNDTLVFPDDSTTAAGLNFRDIQLRFTLDINAASDNVKVFSVDVSYLRIPDVRWRYELDIDIEATVRLEGQQLGNEQNVRDVLETTLDSKTKVVLAYGDRTALLVLPAPEQSLEDIITESSGLTGGKATVRGFHVVLEEV